MFGSLYHYGTTSFVVFFFKQKTAYDMRISDWSSDVCSSDLRPHVDRAAERLTDQRRVGRLVDDCAIQEFGRILVELDTAIVARRHLFAAVEQRRGAIGGEAAARPDIGAAVEALRRQTREARQRFVDRPQIGRASCRERVCQYV